MQRPEEDAVQAGEVAALDASAAAAPRAMRALFMLLGLVFVGLGFIGVFVPLMPSTIFFIGAAACFARSSARLEAWLMSFAFIAGPVRAWRERGAISPKAKRLASLGIGVGFAAFAVGRPPVFALVLVSLCLAAALLFIWSRPNGEVF